MWTPRRMKSRRYERFVVHYTHCSHTLAQKEQQERITKEFFKVTANLHHLVSTKSIPGIYKPRHQPHSEQTIFSQMPIEDHLRYMVSLQSDQLIRSKRQNLIETKRRNAELTANTLNYFEKLSATPHNFTMGTEKQPQIIVNESSLSEQSPGASLPMREDTMRLPPIDARDAMRTKMKRYGPFRRPAHMMETLNSELEPSVARSNQFEEEKQMERFEGRISKLVRIGGDFVVRKPVTPTFNDTIRSTSEYSAPQHIVTRPSANHKFKTPFLPTTSNKHTIFDSKTVAWVGSMASSTKRHTPAADCV